MTAMKLVRLVLAFALIAAVQAPLRAQTSDSVASAERARRVAERKQFEALERQRYRDSLAAGRQRWTHAGIDAYVIQTHIECFCLSTDSGPPSSLLTVRGGRMVARARGKDVRGWISHVWTVDSLFDEVEADSGGATERAIESILQRDGFAEQHGRKVRQLELHPQYGFPLIYTAETPGIADVEITIRVDSFAVLPKAKRTAKSP
jgi:hypothetical protein